MTLKTITRRMNSARKEYVRHPTRAGLRTYLILRARRAIKRGDPLSGWDPRMCRYYGVSSSVNDGCKAAIVRGYAAHLVPTSTKRSPLHNGSYHNERNSDDESMAADLGLVEAHVTPHGPTPYGRRLLVDFQKDEHRRHRAGSDSFIGKWDIIELIGPDNEAVLLRDAETDLAEGTPLETQHDNHVHEAYRG